MGISSHSAAVFGSGGQLGREVCAELVRRGWHVAAFTRAEVNISDPAAVDRALQSANPDVVINAAAYNQVDLAETEPLKAMQVNGLAVRNLAIGARAHGAALVHFSTDYVFDGTAGRAYHEDDPTRPLGAYAVSKLAGEWYAQAYHDHPLVIRTSGVFGPAGRQTARGNFVELMLRLAAESKPIRVVEDFVASPTYAPALAARSVDALERQVSGVLHIGGGVPISWYDWARKIFAAADLTPALTPTNSAAYPTAARRPMYSALENARLKTLGIEPMPALDDALADYFERRTSLVEAIAR